jgi:hypothetical protein
MKIISATVDGKDIDPEQIKADMPKLLKEHEKALKDEPMWDMFGGVIVIEGNRRYQVS